MSDENRNKLNNERKKIEDLKDCMEEMSYKKTTNIKTKIKMNEKYSRQVVLFYRPSYLILTVYKRWGKCVFYRPKSYSTHEDIFCQIISYIQYLKLRPTQAIYRPHHAGL